MDDRNRNRKQKKFNPGIFVVIVLISLLSDAGGEVIGFILGALLVLALLLAPVLLFLFFLRKGKQHKNRPAEPAFDDCPKTFCFHRDKGEHHVRKGREIDPWDRPDIDISKYQRKQ